MSRTYRKERLDELLWQELNQIISYELHDPALEDVSVSRVDVTQDMQVARIYIAKLDESVPDWQVERGLDRARGFIRSQIAGRIQLRRVPDLVFKIDRGHQHAQRVGAILDAIGQTPPTPPDETGPAGDDDSSAPSG